MGTYLTQIFNGISVSSIYLMAALGLSITFGLMKVINMAHGEFIMIGAYSAFLVQNVFLSCFSGAFSVYYLVAIPVSSLIAGAIGYLLEILVIATCTGVPSTACLPPGASA
ncbi:ABC transporter permease subunit [Caproicibacter fermentans]